MSAPRCPYRSCGAALDGCLHHSGDSTIKPTPGSLTVCSHCGGCLVYTDELQLRPITIEEWIALDYDTKRAVSAVTSTSAIIRLYQSYVAAEGKQPETFEQLLRWALMLS